MKGGLFALPLVINGDETDGCLVRRTVECAECAHHECEQGRMDEVRLCREGVNFFRISKTIMARGFIVAGWEPSLSYGRPLRKRFKKRSVTRADSLVRIELVANLMRGLKQTVTQHSGQLEQESLNKLRSEYARRNFEDWAREEVRKATQGLSAALIHDQLQYLATIFQNMEFVLNQRYGDTERAMGQDFPSPNAMSERLQRQVWQKEKAIFVTCELLSERQKAARLLTDDGPPGADDWSLRAPHKIFRKLIRLHDTALTNRGIKVSIGENWAKCFIPSELATIAALAIFDNAVKYAPVNSTIAVKFINSEIEIRAIVESLGPKIETGEIAQLASVAFRGKYALLSGVPGSGIGLWQAKIATRGWGDIGLKQELTESQAFPGTFKTQAFLTFNLHAAPEGLTPRPGPSSRRPPG